MKTSHVRVRIKVWRTTKIIGNARYKSVAIMIEKWVIFKRDYLEISFLRENCGYDGSDERRRFVGTNYMFWAFFWHFYILKVLFLSLFCRYKWYAYGMALYINASIPTKHYNIVKIYVYASEQSERTRKLWHFYILKGAISFNILSVQMICLSASMYRQISRCTDKTPKKHYLGGGGGAVAPPPPPLWLR